MVKKNIEMYTDRTCPLVPLHKLIKSLVVYMTTA